MGQTREDFNISAEHYKGSLVGKIVVVDKNGDGKNFDEAYGDKGFKSCDPLLVTTDKKGQTGDKSGTRFISFKNSHGDENTGRASRFKVLKFAP